MREHLVVTGVSGFIGRHVAAEALRRGYRVTGLDRRPPHTDGIDFVPADIRDAVRVRDAVQGAAAVIHLAAITSNVEFVKRPAECYDVNVNGFLCVLEAAARSGCPRFAYASSAAVYQDRFSEATALDVHRQGNHYAKSKIMNEMMAGSYARIFGMRTIGLRYFNVYGRGENEKGDYASIVSLFLRARAHGEPLVVYGDGSQARDLIAVTDAAHVTLRLLDTADDDVVNVGTGVATTYTAIAEMIDRTRIQYVPNPLAQYQHYTRADTTRLREALGPYPFIDLAQGIAALAAQVRGSAPALSRGST